MPSVFDAWRDQVLAHEHDAAALRGGEHGHGHGGFTYANRPLDIRRTDDSVLNALYAAVSADAHVLDVGGGAGRFALPLATRAERVTVVEPSADSVELLQSRAAEAGLTNIDVINAPWEEADAPSADVALCSLVLHHVPDAAPFVAKMHAHAKQRVLIVEMMETPGALEVPSTSASTVPPPRPCLRCPTRCACCGRWTSSPISRCSPPSLHPRPRAWGLARLPAPPPRRRPGQRGRRPPPRRRGRPARRHARRPHRPRHVPPPPGHPHLAPRRVGD